MNDTTEYAWDYFKPEIGKPEDFHHNLGDSTPVIPPFRAYHRSFEGDKVPTLVVLFMMWIFF